jgi:NAD(P)-dependent dehydrogenase (short-subunit alcohol dehydrogenase family)
MGTPFSRTEDGLELQMATNHFGPFLFTGLLLPQLVASGDGRVVTVSSIMHTTAPGAPLGDPRKQQGRYFRWPVYGQSKLANLLFTSEFDRRLREAGLPIRALAAHPGFAGTHLIANGQTGRSRGGIATILDAAAKAISQSAAAGAWPSLMAATADLPGDTYCGPGGLGQYAGAPQIVGRTPLARNAQAAAQLWEISEETVGLQYP